MHLKSYIIYQSENMISLPNIENQKFQSWI